MVFPNPKAACEWKKIEQYVLRVISSIITDPDDRDDVRQECMIKIWLRGHTFNGGALFSSWVYRVARNEAITWKRRSTRRVQRRENPPAWAAPARRCDEDRVLNGIVARKALSGATELDQRILLLRYVLGFSSPQVGRLVGLAESSVRCRVRNCRAAWRAQRGLGQVPWL